MLQQQMCIEQLSSVDIQTVNREDLVDVSFRQQHTSQTAGSSNSADYGQPVLFSWWRSVRQAGVSG